MNELSYEELIDKFLKLKKKNKLLVQRIQKFEEASLLAYKTIEKEIQKTENQIGTQLIEEEYEKKNIDTLIQQIKEVMQDKQLYPLLDWIQEHQSLDKSSVAKMSELQLLLNEKFKDINFELINLSLFRDLLLQLNYVYTFLEGKKDSFLKEK